MIYFKDYLLSAIKISLIIIIEFENVNIKFISKRKIIIFITYSCDDIIILILISTLLKLFLIYLLLLQCY